MEKKVYRLIVGSLVVASIGARATAPSQTFREGEITFTQGGREDTWRLTNGELRNTGGLLATLQYAPGGRVQNASAPQLDLLFHKSGDVVSIVTLTVKNGPAGDGMFLSGKAVCTLQVTRMDVFAVEGTGRCSGPFEGAAVSKLSFSARNPVPKLDAPARAR